MSLDAFTQPAHYTNTEIFNREQTIIFSRSWAFAGMANEISAPDDYFLFDLAGLSLIVQNCAGKIKAFVNACSHRHARIHDAPRGNRKLICPYHGWNYDDNGLPAGMPAAEQFPQVLANKGAYGLAQFELRCAGHFIFVRLRPGGPGLREFLGPAFDFLEKTSVGLDQKMDEFRGTVAANWKVLIENALEGYHVPMVHRATLGAIRQFSTKPSDVVDHLPDDCGHSYMVNRASQDWLAKWRRFESALGRWPFRFEHYVHQLIFPNLTVTSFMGYSFHIQRFHPDSAGQTTVDSRIYSVHCEGQNEKGLAIMRSVYDEGKRFTQKVFGEDRRICELVQRGLLQATRPAVLANHLEKRIAHFQQNYLLALDGT